MCSAHGDDKAKTWLSPSTRIAVAEEIIQNKVPKSVSTALNVAQRLQKVFVIYSFCLVPAFDESKDKNDKCISVSRSRFAGNRLCTVRHSGQTHSVPTLEVWSEI